MNIVLISGEKIKKICKKTFLKNTIYQSNNLVLQSDSKIKIHQNGNSKFIIFGNIIGVRDKSYNLNSSNSNILNYIFNNSSENISKFIEGRYIIVKISKLNQVKIILDRFAQYDLYYKKIDKNFIFASNLELINRYEVLNDYDQSSLIHSLYIYGFRPTKKNTIYKNVKRLGVNEFATLNISNLKISYKNLNIFKINQYTNNELYTYRDIFLDSVKKRSSSKGNIVYLSSGWDSTSILAALVKLYGSKKTRAVIGRMNFSKKHGVCNPFEIKRAKAIADYYGVKLEIVEFDYYKRGPEITEKHKDDMKSHMMTGMSFYQWIDLANYVSKTYNGESVFSGEISDGAHNFGFSQYATILDHPVFEFREYSDKMQNYIFGPTFLKSLWNGTFKDDLVYKILKNKNANCTYEKPAKNKIDLHKQFLESNFARDNRFPFWSLKNNKTLKKYGIEIYSNTLRKDYFNEAAKNINSDNLYSWYLNLYNSFHWQGGTVASLDITANLYGFNMNFPFRDSRMIEFLSKMPEYWGRGLELKPTKYPLKWILENCIDYPIHLQTGPHSYLYDIDSGFDHAKEWVYRSAFSRQYKEILRKKDYLDVLSPKVFNVDYYNKIIDNYISGNEQKEGLDWGSNLANIIFLSVMGWYK